MSDPASVHQLSAEFSKPEHERLARKMFQNFDVNNNGFLDRVEYGAFLEEFWQFAAELGRLTGVNLDKSARLSDLQMGYDSNITFPVFWARLQLYAALLNADLGTNGILSSGGGGGGPHKVHKEADGRDGPSDQDGRKAADDGRKAAVPSGLTDFIICACVFGELDKNSFAQLTARHVRFSLDCFRTFELARTGLYLVYERADGNCLFRSVARQIKVGHPDQTFADVRLETARLMRCRPELDPGTGFSPEVFGFPTYAAFVAAREDAGRWLNGCVGQRNDWGFHHDLVAIATCYQRPIHIYRCKQQQQIQPAQSKQTRVPDLII
eukprot:gb/GEZN01013411.1/.p1 GENE.gb/GEZN01013411.1/~~gb/GEZN01013411.1/.p1  ORF type:complete len:324 (-),score=30.87 gb/GEZN01013411.1/:4-975(-)